MNGLRAGGFLSRWVGVMLLAGCVWAAEPDAAARAGHLRRGINASIWFAQAPGNYGVERLRSFTTVEDLDLMARVGFDHVRLSVDPEPLQQWARHPEGANEFVTELDRVIDAMLARHLAVILDIHPETRFKAQLFQGTEAVTRFGGLWRALAARYADRDADLLFFEIMNEPEQQDVYRWQGVQASVAAQIREAAPNHTIIATGGRWSGIQDLLLLQPLSLGNVIYTFHDYDPFAFTHQAATWTDPNVEPLHGVPYPSSPEAVAPVLSQEPTLAAQYFVEQYGLDRWDAGRIDQTVAFAERWGALHHVPVYCGEFGVHRPAAEPGQRARWIRDMRTGLERHHIGWAMWDYQTNFGVVTKTNGGAAVPDAAVVEALGLHVPAGPEGGAGSKPGDSAVPSGGGSKESVPVGTKPNLQGKKL